MSVVACTCLFCAVDPIAMRLLMGLVAITCVVVMTSIIGHCHRREKRLKQLLQRRQGAKFT